MPKSNRVSFSVQQQLRENRLIEAGFSGNIGSGFTAFSYDLKQVDNQCLALARHCGSRWRISMPAWRRVRWARLLSRGCSR